MADEKKHKSGFALLKEKLAKAEAKINELEQQLNVEVAEHQALEDKYEKLREELIRTTQDGHKQYNEQQESIEQQSRKISQLTADLKVAQGNLEATEREHERQLKAMYDHMGWFKRMTWDWHHAPTFKEDERWNETH